MEKQLRLDGKAIEQPDEDEPSVALLKSALQKSIRRGNVEKSMTFALMLLEKGGDYMTWRRLKVIAVEDVGQPEIITAIETLHKLFLEWKSREGKDRISWDAKMCVTCAAKILAESPKDRRSDEFLELWDAMEKHKDIQALQNLKALWTHIPDEAYDLHTIQGRKMGRGAEYWYSVSSKVENPTEKYKEWREWWEGIMIALCRMKSQKLNTNVQRLEESEKE